MRRASGSRTPHSGSGRGWRPGAEPVGRVPILMTHSNRIIKGRWIAGAAVVALLAGACGGGSSGGDTSGGGGGSVASGGQVVEIDVASSGFAFAQSTATASAGHVTIKS